MRAMASVLSTTRFVRAEIHTDPRVEGFQAQSPALEPLLRFGLRQLFIFVAAISALLAAIASTSGLTALVLMLAATIVVMHVFATAVGTKLQSRAEQERLRDLAAQQRANESISVASERSAKLQAIRSAPRSPWHGRGCTYLPWLSRLIAGAVAVGGLAGALLLGGMIGHRPSPEGIIVGAVSCAVLGGWIAFLCGNFYGVFRHGFREALAEQQKDQAHRPSSPIGLQAGGLSRGVELGISQEPNWSMQTFNHDCE
jgi:hypothetical protein